MYGLPLMQIIESLKSCMQYASNMFLTQLETCCLHYVFDRATSTILQVDAYAVFIDFAAKTLYYISATAVSHDANLLSDFVEVVLTLRR